MFCIWAIIVEAAFFNLLFSEMDLIRVFTQYPPSAAFVSMLVSLPSTVENHFLCSLYSPSLSMASTNMVCPIFVLRVYPCGYILFLASSCIWNFLLPYSLPWMQPFSFHWSLQFPLRLLIVRCLLLPCMSIISPLVHLCVFPLAAYGKVCYPPCGFQSLCVWVPTLISGLIYSVHAHFSLIVLTWPFPQSYVTLVLLLYPNLTGLLDYFLYEVPTLLHVAKACIYTHPYFFLQWWWTCYSNFRLFAPFKKLMTLFSVPLLSVEESGMFPDPDTIINWFPSTCDPLGWGAVLLSSFVLSVSSLYLFGGNWPPHYIYFYIGNWWMHPI